jgi:CHAT domain-containing protein
MNKKILILFFFGFLHVSLSSGQCPDRDSLWNRLVFLRNSSTILPSEQLRELLVFEARMKNCPYSGDSTNEFLLRRIGAVYFQISDYLKASQYLRQCIQIITAHYGKPDVNPKQLVTNYYWLSRCYDSLGMHIERMQALDSCAAIALRLGTLDKASLWALYARVEYSYDIGDYERCINYALLCEMLGNEYSKISSSQENQDGKGYALSSLEWNVNALLALKNYDHAEELLANKVDEYKRSGLKEYLGIAYEHLAKVEIHKENYEKALIYFNKAVAAERALGNDSRSRILLGNIGYEVYYKHFQDTEKALVYYKKALYHPRKVEKLSISESMESLNILTHIADAYVQRGSYDSALDYFQLAFDQIGAGLNELGILRSRPEEFARYPNIYYLTNLFIDKGDAYRKKYNATGNKAALENAIDMYRSTDRLLDRIKSEQFDLRSKLFWRADSRRLYEHAIEACYLQGNAGEAFYFFEKSRATLLNDQLNEQNWLDEGDIHLQTQVKKKILQLEREIYSLDKASVRFKELQGELFTNRQQLDGLVQKIKTRNPLYYQSSLDSNVITVVDAKKNILIDHQAFLELFSGDSAVYSLMITSHNIQFTKINKTKFDSLTKLFIHFISDVALQNNNFEVFQQVSAQLYKLIFPFNLPAGRVIISPDGLYFPFEALVCNIHPLTYLMKEHSISYTYSGRFLMNQFAASSNTGKDFLGIAPVSYPSVLHLATLKGSDRSLEKIGSYFKNANTLVAKQASKDNFLQMFSEYQVIQLYTHASGTSKNGEPVIYFADSALYLSDILSESKPLASIIVLSACETGNGTLYKGEGVFSLNRAFAALGIPSSISNLWTSENESTYRLTELFYKYLSAGVPTDIALQNAKLDFLAGSSKSHQLPYYWAGTILIGKNYTPGNSREISWKLIAVIVSVSTLVFWLVMKIYRSNKQIKQKRDGMAGFTRSESILS